MGWVVNVTEEFEAWYDGLDEPAQDDIDVMVHLLEEKGHLLARPYADTLDGSEFANMKELRVQSNGRPFRIAFAFDSNREALLLCGGNKEGQKEKQFYRALIGQADALFAKHCADLEGN